MKKRLLSLMLVIVFIFSFGFCLTGCSHTYTVTIISTPVNASPNSIYGKAQAE